MSPELIRLIADTLEMAKDGEVSADEVMGVLIKAREAMPVAWENHGGSPVELLEEIDRAISGNSTNITNAKNIVKEIADKFGISLTAWIPNDAFAGHWEFADAEFEGQSIRLGTSGGGVVQVNRDPFTPTGDRVPNVTIDAIEASIMAAANINFAKADRTYVGTVIHQAENSIAVQNVGKGIYVAHDPQASKGMKKGTSYTIKYDSQRKISQIKPKTKGSEELAQGI
jgi:phosphopentomutase